jgi:hypothetical protein
MSEVTDLVMPVLQRIQADLADVKRVLALHSEKHDDHTRRFEEHSRRFDDMEIYIAYETGLSAQNKVDLQAIRKRVEAVEKRLTALEPQV